MKMKDKIIRFGDLSPALKFAVTTAFINGIIMVGYLSLLLIFTVLAFFGVIWNG